MKNILKLNFLDSRFRALNNSPALDELAESPPNRSASIGFYKCHRLSNLPTGQSICCQALPEGGLIGSDSIHHRRITQNAPSETKAEI